MSTRVGRPPLTHRLAEWATRESTLLFAIGLWLALVQISIAASQIVLTFVFLLWLFQWAMGRVELVRLPLDLPIGLFGAFSLAAAAFSFDPASSLTSVKKLVLFVVPYLLVSSVRRVSTLEKLMLLLVAVADLGALFSLWQYYFGDMGDINHRIRGFMSHYMTFSGLLMGVSTLALSRLLFVGRPRTFLLASLALLYSVLLLTLTRNAWLGVIAAATLLCFLRNWRFLVALPLVIAAALALVPSDVRSRVGSFIEPDRSGQDRVFMLKSGLRMTASHPWFGVGPNMVPAVYPIYLVEGAPHQDNIHLHNNMAQIAAERGLPCLVAWLWLMFTGLRWSIKAYRSSATGTKRSLAAGALGVLVATLAAGFFEYNFGDSEFLMLVLFVMAIPFLLVQNRLGAQTS
ncbi:MAG: O-antigen ligase family protein [Acidobacteriota bacterium]